MTRYEFPKGAYFPVENMLLRLALVTEIPPRLNKELIITADAAPVVKKSKPVPPPDAAAARCDWCARSVLSALCPPCRCLSPSLLQPRLQLHLVVLLVHG